MVRSLLKLVLIAKFRDFHCGLLFPMHGDLDLIPGRGTKISRAEWCDQKLKKKKKYKGGGKNYRRSFGLACGRMTM